MKKLLFFLIVLTGCIQNSIGQYDSIYVNGMYRTYQLHLPTGYTGTSDLSLVIAMHGGGGSGPQLALQSTLNITSNAENFIVVYPEGVKSIPGGIRTWNAGWCCGYAADNNINDVDFISALIDSLNLNYAIDLNRVYATGMSNGGFMSYRLACELSERIAAFAPVAASMGMDNCTPAIPVPLISFHSFLDTNVPVNGGTGSGFSDHWNAPQDSVLAVWALKNGCDADPDTLTNNSEYLHLKWNNCNCGYTSEQYITQDGGHSWPGGIAFGDPVSAYIDANDLMWIFFSQYDLSCPLNLKEKTETDFIIYPNPAENSFRIILPSASDIDQVTIQTIQGTKIAFESSVSENGLMIEPVNAGTGYYVMTIQTGDRVVSKMFVLK